MLRLKKQTLALAGILMGMLFVAVSCDKKEPQYATPAISVNGASNVELAPGETAEIKLTLSGDGGAKSVVVNKNGGFLREFPVHATAREFIYTTDPVPAGLEEGAEIKYSFILVNKNGIDSPETPVAIKVALYGKITVGTTELYNLNVGTDGIVLSGQHVKLVAGRNYFVPAALTFEAGSSLTIEEGVQVYMNADAPDAVGIEIAGEADIAGTADNPVVITSSKLLSDASSVVAGDWGRFALTGTGASSNNGKVSYLRLEYGGDRAFRLSGVGAATRIDHIQVYRSTGEGFMITDGNVQLQYLVATDCRGGSYRLGDKYEGKMQFVVSVSSERFAENDDFAIREDAAPVISNVTLLGPGESVANTHGMRMRANAAPKVYNAVIAGFPRRGLRAQDNVTITDLSGTAVFAYSYIFNVKTDPYRDLASAFAGTFDAGGNRTANPFFNNATAKSGKNFVLESIAGIGVNDFIPDAEKTSDFNPKTLDAFFSDAPFAGAVKNEAGDWTKGWVKNPDGSIRK